MWTRAELEQKAPGIDWAALLDAAQLGGAQKFDAYHSDGDSEAGRAGRARNRCRRWKDWLAFHTLNQQANVLPKAFRDASFAFNGTTLPGTPEQRPRDKLALNATSNALQDAVGKAYVDKYFPASAKAEIQEMVDNIKAAFARRVQAIDWMAPSTKQEALKKVEDDRRRRRLSRHVARLFGAADRRRQRLRQPEGAGLFEYRNQIAKIGKPMDRARMVDAAAAGQRGQSAGAERAQLPGRDPVRPFFDPKADAAFNYGAIGATIGHEISHSFDNNGALFDAERRAAQLVDPGGLQQLPAGRRRAGRAISTPTRRCPGLHVNGKLTLGENIADVAGLAAAYDAYKASLNGKAAPVIDGLTGDQRFFLAFAQSWAAKTRGETLRNRSRPTATHPSIPRSDGAQPRCLVPGVQRASRARSYIWRRTSGEDLGLIPWRSRRGLGGE